MAKCLVLSVERNSVPLRKNYSSWIHSSWIHSSWIHSSWISARSAELHFFGRMAVVAVILMTGCHEKAKVSDTVSLSESTVSVPNQPVELVSNRRRTIPNKYPQLLSEYQLYRGELADLEPAEGVIVYDVNTPLFSDYSAKHRVIRMPEGTSAQYAAFEAFDFPVGTEIAKTFYYDHDMNDSARGRRLIETRILKRTDTGWIGLPYVWNAEQTDATLSLAGEAVEVKWIHNCA